MALSGSKLQIYKSIVKLSLKKLQRKKVQQQSQIVIKYFQKALQRLIGQASFILERNSQIKNCFTTVWLRPSIIYLTSLAKQKSVKVMNGYGLIQKLILILNDYRMDLWLITHIVVKSIAHKTLLFRKISTVSFLKGLIGAIVSETYKEYINLANNQLLIQIAKKSCQKILKPMIVIGISTVATISMDYCMTIVKNIMIKTSEIIKILLNHVIKIISHDS